jgi:hypothetical protein
LLEQNASCMPKYNSLYFRESALEFFCRTEKRRIQVIRNAKKRHFGAIARKGDFVIYGNSIMSSLRIAVYKLTT